MKRSHSLAISTALFCLLTPHLWAYVQIGADIDGKASYHRSGKSVAMSTDKSRVAIGAYSGGMSNPGSVRIFQYNGSIWTQLGADINGEAAFDQSGSSVAMSADGSRVAIGAPYNDGNGADSGHVRIFQYNGSSWTQLGADINGEAAADGSGFSVAMSADGSRVAIGAPYNVGNGIDSGHVRIFQYNGSSWTQLGADINGKSGFSIAMSADGSRVAIGAPSNSGNPTTSRAKIFQYNGSSWAQLGADINGETTYENPGTSVAMSADGSRVAIGASYNNGNGSASGQVRIFQSNGSSWTQLGADINGEAAADMSGSSVAMSADGSRVAIGAPYNDGNGSDSGQVRIFQFNGSIWTQLGADINGEAAGDRSGSSVAISADGSLFAIGAPDNDGNGSGSGHTRIFADESFTGMVYVDAGGTNPVPPFASWSTASTSFEPLTISRKLHPS